MVSTPENDSERQLRQFIAERVRAVRAKDIDTLIAQLAPDVVLFDVLPPLVLRGAEVVTKTADWFAAYPGDIGYEIDQLEVAADGDVGFCSFLYHVTGRLGGGQDVDMWVRALLGCRRVEGRWLITHDHESVPFDPVAGSPTRQAERA